MKESLQHPQSGAVNSGARFSWALYDWANSSFAAIISTFLFPAYFARQVAIDETTRTTQWGMTEE
jgi:MFS transporter, UMF1 family